MEHIDVAIIGGGVTGLAAARAIASRQHSVCVLERHPRPGLDTSTHNSGVIHAGLYHAPDTLKARLCVEGRPLLYEFCRDRGVAHAQCGKLVVAARDRDVAQLEAILARGRANGVEGLEIVDRAFIARREPAVNAVAALFSPATGIVEAEGLIRALLESARASGAIFLPGTPIAGAEQTAGPIRARPDSHAASARGLTTHASIRCSWRCRSRGGARTPNEMLDRSTSLGKATGSTWGGLTETRRWIQNGGIVEESWLP